MKREFSKKTNKISSSRKGSLKDFVCHLILLLSPGNKVAINVANHKLTG